MAITHVQQSQISGSLAWDANKTLGASLAGQSNLVGDLDALRSLVLDIKGDGDWYDAAGQDLKEVYDAMHADGANAEMQGQLNVIGALIVSGNTILGNGSGDRITFTALADSGLNMNTHKVSGLEQATAAGEALAWGQDASVSDLIVTAGDFTVDGSGNVDVGGTLGVDGLATFDSLATFYAGITVNTGSGDFNDGITANDIKIDSDAKTHLYFVGDSGEIADSADLRYSAATLWVSGAVEISNGLSILAGGLELAGDKLEVTGSVHVTADIFIAGDVAQRLYIVGSTGEIKDEANLNFTGSTLEVTGAVKVTDALEVGGGYGASGATMSAAGALSINDSLVVDGTASFAGGYGSTGVTISSIGALSMDGILTVDDSASFAGGYASTGVSISASGDLDMAGILTVDGNAHFKTDVNIDGDLYVKGATTYIETANLRVNDAFIYLATGSHTAGNVDSGIVLAGGAGANLDLVMGQDSGAGEFIFGKMDRSPDGSGAMNGIDLVNSWMKGVLLGSVESTELAHLAVSGSSGAVELSVGGDLGLQANGSKFNFAASGNQTAFEGQFGLGVSVIEAIVAAASGGNFAKGALTTTAGQASLDFTSVGVLRSGYDVETSLDVFLNGVLLVGTDDYTLTNDHVLQLAYNFSAGDVVTIIIRNAV